MLARDLFPVKAFEGYLDRFEPFFSGDFMPRIAWPRKLDITAEWRPNADIIEKKDEYLVKAELPEVKKEDVKVDVVEGLLKIRAECAEGVQTVHIPKVVAAMPKPVEIAIQ